MPDDAVTLTPWETSALVAHMFAVWLREHDLPWVAWEVVPELSEAAFEAFVTRAERLADQLADRCDDIIDFVVGLAEYGGGAIDIAELVRRVSVSASVVGADHEWTDESRPFVLMFAEPLSAREAALTIVGEAVWSSMLDGSCDDLSALEWAGLVAVLNDVSELSSAAHIDRFTSGVLAWFTSRMVRSVMCVADGHDGGDGRRWFGRCDADEDDDECPTCSSRVRDERLDLADDATCGAGWHDEPSASPHHMMDIWFVEGDAAEFVPFVIALAERWLR